MNLKLRQLFSGLFSFAALSSVMLLTAALVVLLGPILWIGSSAVIFKGTVGFRRMQLDIFGRGDQAEIQRQQAQVAQARQPVYDLLDSYRRILDTDEAEDRINNLYREYTEHLRNLRSEGQIDRAEYGQRRDLLKDNVRDPLRESLNSAETDRALALIDQALGYSDHEHLQSPQAREIFEIARGIRGDVEQYGVEMRGDEDLVEAFVALNQKVRELFGPRSGEDRSNQARLNYGTTRWDQTQKALDELLYRDVAVSQGFDEQGNPLPDKIVSRPRVEQFEGMALAEIFPLIENNIKEMTLPRWTFYWQFFIDPGRGSEHFGGVGYEMLGTFLLAAMAMAFATPLGVIAAAYLVECAKESPLLRAIRTCINTLAGVPSIVFGLFGLAFFCNFLIPKVFGEDYRGYSALAGGLTLGLMVLPIIIRASEEAIRSVPRGYREASLALGASKVRTFLTVTIPAALPGILTGLILSISRAAGETAPIMLTATVAMGDLEGSPINPLTPKKALPYAAYEMIRGTLGATDLPHKKFGIVATLIVLVLSLNIVAILVRSRIAKRLHGH